MACAGAGRQDDEAIELAFSKKKIEERKAWLAGFEPGTYLDQSVSDISYFDFVNKAGARPPSCLADALRLRRCFRAPSIVCAVLPQATLCRWT